jgi:hypothetical protein
MTLYKGLPSDMYNIDTVGQLLSTLQAPSGFMKVDTATQRTSAAQCCVAGTVCGHPGGDMSLPSQCLPAANTSSSPPPTTTSSATTEETVSHEVAEHSAGYTLSDGAHGGGSGPPGAGTRVGGISVMLVVLLLWALALVALCVSKDNGYQSLFK